MSDEAKKDFLASLPLPLWAARDAWTPKDYRGCAQCGPLVKDFKSNPDYSEGPWTCRTCGTCWNGPYFAPGLSFKLKPKEATP